jgi:transcriptional regulator with XRE-family HTH domain
MLKSARKKAGISREEASFRLHIGCRTLADYEAGKTTAPPDVVLKMAEVYDQPDLPADYCANLCPIGQIFAHSFEKTNLAVTVLRVLQEFNQVEKLKDRLISIASDGRLTVDEKPEFENILREVVELEKQIGELKIFAMKHGINVMSDEKEKTA